MEGLGRPLVLEPRRREPQPLELAIFAPIASPPLRELVSPDESVVIVTSDVTRPCPTAEMLPLVVDELARAGVRDENILVVFGLGVHRGHTEEEQRRLVGPEMYRRLRCVDSDPERVIEVGTTRRGTPVELFEPVVKAEKRIVLGVVELHYFAGYSGGAKAIFPGVSTLRSIKHNHGMMTHANARAGVLRHNPVREDIEEAAALVGIDYVFNVILDGQKEVTLAAAGHPLEAHRWACRVVDYQSKFELEKPVDVVLVSAGGYPKDIDLYQAQKALDNAASAVRPNGEIVWVAECREGIGSEILEAWLTGHEPDDVIARLEEEFVLGGHKAAAIARVLKHAHVTLVSSLADDRVRGLGFTPCSDVEDALRAAMRRAGPHASLAVLPQGASVLVAT